MRKGKGRSIELFFVNGDPDGLVVATIPFQWTGHVLVTRRTQIKEALGRAEADRPGVYLLLGDVDGSPILYVGETDSIKTRIQQHLETKDWWDRAVLISASGDPLNKAHVRYLESELFQIAKRIGKITLDNKCAPTASQLSDAAKAHMDDFIDNLLLVLPALGFDIYNDDSVSKPEIQTVEAGEITRFVFAMKKEKITANARLEDGNFIVEKGSTARSEWVNANSHAGYSKLHGDLVSQGILQRDGQHCHFTRDYKFNSTSAAAAIICGRTANGPISWKVFGTNQTYSEWEKSNLQ